MPELPEVETIIKGLRPNILGKQIDQLQILLPKTVWLDTVRATGSKETDIVKALLEGNKIASITRRGKMIIIKLSDEIVALVHLKMTGQLIYVGSDNKRFAGGHPTGDMGKEMPVKSTRAIIRFTDGSYLYFNDQRQFGYIKVLTPSQFISHLDSLKFGPEALSDDFSTQYLYKKSLNRPKITIKQLLLDQHVVAGVGNIYADEGLYNARIHPSTPAQTISLNALEDLIKEIKAVLQFSIDHNGTSSEHYVMADGQTGDMQNYLNVYRRHGLPCKRCGEKIERMVIGGRGTHFCPRCQPRTV